MIHLIKSIFKYSNLFLKLWISFMSSVRSFLLFLLLQNIILHNVIICFQLFVNFLLRFDQHLKFSNFLISFDDLLLCIRRFSSGNCICCFDDFISKLFVFPIKILNHGFLLLLSLLLFIIEGFLLLFSNLVSFLKFYQVLLWLLW